MLKFVVGCILFLAINVISSHNLTDTEKVEIFNKIVVEIIEDCYPNLTSVLVYGEHLDGVAKDLNKLEQVNLVLQQKTSSEELSDPIDFYRSIESLIIIENSSKDIFWIKNHNVTSVMKIKMILIFEISDNCNYQNSFNIAWSFGTSSAFHICVFSETHQEVITSNPINNYAPSSWTFKSEQTLKNYSPAAIFYRNYTRETACQDIEFDRTKNLDGHTMNAILVDAEFNETRSSNNVIINSKNFHSTDVCPLLNGFFTFCFIKTFNISLNITFIPLFNTSEHLSNFNRILAESVDFSIDILSQYGEGFDDWKYIELAFPLLISSDYIVTHKRGLFSPLEKIFNYYGYVTLISSSVILLITFGVIYKAENRRLSFAFFECLRLLISNSLYTRMPDFKFRIFFSVVFLYFLIIQATFSGHLTAFLTKPEFRKNVETIDDLSDPRYTQIYARHGTEAYFTNKSFVNKVIFHYDNCWDVIEENTLVACVDDFLRLVFPIAYYDLHYTKKMSYNIWSIPLRKNWILKSYANSILMRLDQAGISEKVFVDLHSEAYHIIKERDRSMSLADYYRPIILNDLSFIFKFLVLGLLISLLSFIIEIFIYQKKQRHVKMKSILIPTGFLFVKCRDVLNNVHYYRNNKDKKVILNSNQIL